MKRIHLAALTALIGVMVISFSPTAYSADGMQLQMRVVDPSKRYVPPKPRRDTIVFRGQSRNTSWLDPDFSNVPGYDPNMASEAAEAEAPVAPVVRAASKLAEIKPAPEKKSEKKLEKKPKVKLAEKTSTKKSVAKASSEKKANGKAMKIAKDTGTAKSKTKLRKKTLVAEKAKFMPKSMQKTVVAQTTTLASNSVEAARSASLALMRIETPEIAK